MHKYRAKKTIVDGIYFDSQKEASRYIELKILQRSKKICNLVLQPQFELVPKQKGERSVKYRADFMYTENGKTIVEDVKGMKTKDYIIKRKLFKCIYGDKYEFKEV